MSSEVHTCCHTDPERDLDTTPFCSDLLPVSKSIFPIRRHDKRLIMTLKFYICETFLFSLNLKGIWSNSSRFDAKRFLCVFSSHDGRCEDKRYFEKVALSLKECVSVFGASESVQMAAEEWKGWLMGSDLLSHAAASTLQPENRWARSDGGDLWLHVPARRNAGITSSYVEFSHLQGEAHSTFCSLLLQTVDSGSVWL